MNFSASKKLSPILLNILINLLAFVKSQDCPNSCVSTNGEYTSGSKNAEVGACYGTLGNNLAPPAQVIALCNEHNIRRIRLYNPNPSILQALEGQHISVILGVANEDIPGLARNASLAKSWVRNNVVNYRNVSFRYIAVGNEISPLNNATSGIAPSVVPAMRNICAALSAFGFGRRVKVSTVLTMEVLGQSYPPSIGAFWPEIRPAFINPIIKFLVKTKGPFLVNVYPYFSYIGNRRDIRLSYALFLSRFVIVRDGKYEYRNLFDAMVDALHAALESAGAGSVEVVVAETGWPSGGGTAASVANAWTYNFNLVRKVKEGSPRKPGKAIEVYIFDLIDENLKSPKYEKHWGLFLANKTQKYPLEFN